MSTRPRLWIDRSPEERRRILNGTFIPRTLCNELIAAMDRVRRNMQEGAEPTCITFVGGAGVGKSSILKNYAAGEPVTESIEDGCITRKRPVLYVSFPESTGLGDAADITIRALMGPTAPQGRRARYVLLPEQLKLQGVELMIFDEFQHVLEKGAEKTRAATRDWIKYLTKETKVPALQAGMDSINAIVDGDEQLGQLTPYRFGLPRYGYKTAKEKKDFRDFLAELDRYLPFDHPAHLADPDRARRLHMACGGVLRPFCILLRRAADLAIAENAGCIRDHDFARAHDEVGPLLENPFEEWL
jgi:hypothetical protein